jgi:putative heme-binding domain-containing protein
VDLGEEVPIDAIVIYNRTDGPFGGRLRGFTLKVLDAGRKEVFVREKNPAPKVKAEFAVGGGGAKSMIRRAAMNAIASVRGYEAETFRLLARFIREDVDRSAAIRAMQRIPQAYWPKEGIEPLVESLIDHIRAIPTPERTSPTALEALDLAQSLAGLLPAKLAQEVRLQLGELGVRVIRLGTIPHRMTFDKDRMVVEAGKPVELVFENSDIMPHNVVVTVMGALEEIGLLAEATATAPDAFERGYVPESPKILLSSRLLQPRESQKLSFVAPESPGVYPYVCTFPGHWRRMYGALYVVEDLNDYLVNPEAYLAERPMEIADELLKFSRPRTEWKFDDLAALVGRLEEGRSFANGQEMFRVANCVACHQLGGEGLQVGPDLTKLDPKWTPVDVLRELIDPSARINEDYFSYVFELDSGKVVTGLVLEDTPEVVKVVENPLVKTKALELKPAEIVSREKSPTSIMPTGLADRLTREEILDLIAYVASRGDRLHPLFAGHAGH